jgi:hypothetical protein
LTAAEARKNGAVQQSFEVRNLETLAVEKRAESPGALTPFVRWQAPEWRAKTIALR